MYISAGASLLRENTSLQAAEPPWPHSRLHSRSWEQGQVSAITEPSSPPVMSDVVTALLRARATFAQRKSRTFADKIPLNTGDKRTGCKYRSHFLKQVE